MKRREKNKVYGLYAITPDEADTSRLLQQIAAAIQGGARLVQYRNKSATPQLRQQQARALHTLCRAFEVPLIVNDHLDLALDIGAEGLHLGADDGDIAAARAALGAQRLLGVSCYSDLHLAQSAVAAGADHIAFGSVFASGTKPDASAASLRLFAEARSLHVPLVGIGGITPANLPQLIKAGADAAAVIGALFCDDGIDMIDAIEQRARQLSTCFETFIIQDKSVPHPHPSPGGRRA